MGFEDHKEEIYNCLFNLDSTLIGSGSADRTARVWDVRNQKCFSNLLHDDEVCCFSLIFFFRSNTLNDL